MTHQQYYAGFLFAAGLAVCGPAIAQGVPQSIGESCSEAHPYVPDKLETWSAASTTAMAITEDIAISPNMIRFGNGVVAHIRYLGNVRKESAGEGGAFFGIQCVALYAFEPPLKEFLRRGTPICGPNRDSGASAESAVYLAAGLTDDGKRLGLAAYGLGSSKILLSSLSGELCGTFGYSRTE